jgi:hypothetical protein
MTSFSLSLYAGRGLGRGCIGIWIAEFGLTKKKNPLPCPLPEYREREM